MCNFMDGWAGQCKNENVPGENYCSKHFNLKCCVCDKQATHSCAETMGFVCGAPLCDDCEHTIQSNGCNSGGDLPPGLGSHCRKTEQVYKPWFVQESEETANVDE